jgi:hypothetical protein
MERIGENVERELARSGGGAVLALAEITAAWPRAVGEAVARQAWPLRLGRDGTLHVGTTSATWAFELDRMSADVLARLAAVLGNAAPAAIRFRVGPVPEPGAPSEPRRGTAGAGVADTTETSAEGASVASEIDDPELRELVARAVSASLARSPQTGNRERGSPSREDP